MIDFLRSIKLTIAQWLFATMATAIGILVLLLRRKGSQLHRAQVDLLELKVTVADDRAEHNADVAFRHYEDVKAEFLKNGGSLE